jgi:hypothetical protein
MSTSPTPIAVEPRIQSLLVEAHAARQDLEVTRLMLLQRGLSSDDLPATHHLHAYAALLDHDRAAVLAQVSGEPWAQMLDLGLVNVADPAAVGTARLRLLAHILPVLGAVDSLETLLSAGDPLPEPSSELLRVLGTTSGCYWGETLQLQIRASREVLALRIHADGALDMDALLLRASGGGPIQEEVHLLADEGRLVLTVQTTGGAVYRTVVPVQLAQSVEEIW